MKIQIVDDNGDVLHDPSGNASFEADLAVILAPFPGAAEAVAAACAALRLNTLKI